MEVNDTFVSALPQEAREEGAEGDSRGHRRWSTILTLSMDAERRALGIEWLDRLEASAAAYSFMTYRYRAYLPPPLLNTFTAERQKALPPGAYREWLRGDDDQPFNTDEEAYADGTKANDPPNTGRWWWTNRDIGQFRPDLNIAGRSSAARRRWTSTAGAKVRIFHDKRMPQEVPGDSVSDGIADYAVRVAVTWGDSGSGRRGGAEQQKATGKRRFEDEAKTGVVAETNASAKTSGKTSAKTGAAAERWWNDAEKVLRKQPNAAAQEAKRAASNAKNDDAVFPNAGVAEAARGRDGGRSAGTAEGKARGQSAGAGRKGGWSKGMVLPRIPHFVVRRQREEGLRSLFRCARGSDWLYRYRSRAIRGRTLQKPFHLSKSPRVPSSLR
ncbi:MAG: hypothetical protein BJ554DRAFT_8343 [Olpidium bornovanus]|uniref:Uncharacterized protein n=1 Tax=Olpidium bornovanus TaxID=278681 RepID=A0A8H7ZUH1_9FUNG|nr:MAG: hypothetical protein BJ554DRAFT_8343 [Olpidium bornovanus]